MQFYGAGRKRFFFCITTKPGKSFLQEAFPKRTSVSFPALLYVSKCMGEDKEKYLSSLNLSYFSFLWKCSRNKGRKSQLRLLKVTFKDHLLTYYLTGYMSYSDIVSVVSAITDSRQKALAMSLTEVCYFFSLNCENVMINFIVEVFHLRGNFLKWMAETMLSDVKTS